MDHSEHVFHIQSHKTESFLDIRLKKVIWYFVFWFFVALSLYMFFLTLGTDIWYLLQVTCGMFGDALSV